MTHTNSCQPFFSDIAEDLLTFIEDAEVLMHNADFDLGFLNNEINILQSDYPTIETVSSNVIMFFHFKTFVVLEEFKFNNFASF